MTAIFEMPRIQVCVAHRDCYVAAGIRALLRAQAGLSVQAPGAGGGLADVLVTDYESALGQVPAMAVRRGLSPPVLVVTDQQTAWQIRRAVDAGVRGYLLHDCSAAELSEAVRCIAEGRGYLSRSVSERLMDSLAYAVPTARELQVLRLLARGLGNKDIGRQLGIGEGTVKTHVKALFAKFGESTRTGAMVEASRRGFLSEASQEGVAQVT